MNEQPHRSVEVFPAVQLLVLFGVLTVALAIVIGVTPGPPPRPATPTPRPTEVAAAQPTLQPSPIPPTAAPEVAEVAALDPAQVAAGEQLYQTTCAACHGFNALGIPSLGFPLIGNEFVNEMTDDEFHDFLVVGRPATDPANTTGVAMPARGGNPSLTDEDLYNIVAYIRSLNQDVPVAAAPTAVPTEAGPRPTATEWVAPSLPSGAAEGEATDEAEAAEDRDDPFFTSGEVAYNRACAGCHGLDGEGVEFTGPALLDSTYLTEREGIGLLEFLTAEEPPVNPEEAYPHPYRGGYPPLTDEQILNIIAYLHELRGEQ